MIDVPKLKYPFNISDGRPDLVEQDTIDEIAQCVYAILATDEGSRVEEPDFGLPDQSFRKGGLSEQDLLEAISEWEPRVESVGVESNWEQVKETVRVLIHG